MQIKCSTLQTIQAQILSTVILIIFVQAEQLLVVVALVAQDYMRVVGVDVLHMQPAQD